MQFYNAINNFLVLLSRDRGNVYRNIFPITYRTLRMFHNSVLKALIGNSGQAHKPYLPTLPSVSVAKSRIPISRPTKEITCNPVSEGHRHPNI